MISTVLACESTELKCELLARCLGFPGAFGKRYRIFTITRSFGCVSVPNGEPAIGESNPVEALMVKTEMFPPTLLVTSRNFVKSATKRNFPPTSVTNPRGPLASTGKGDPVTSVNLPLQLSILNTRTKLPVKSETKRNCAWGSATSPSASFGPGKVPAFAPKGRVRVPSVVSTLKSAIWFNAVAYRNSGLTGGTQLGKL